MDLSKPYTKKMNKHILPGLRIYSKFFYGDVRDPLKVYRGKDCSQLRWRAGLQEDRLKFY